MYDLILTEQRGARVVNRSQWADSSGFAANEGLVASVTKKDTAFSTGGVIVNTECSTDLAMLSKRLDGWAACTPFWSQEHAPICTHIVIFVA